MVKHETFEHRGERWTRYPARAEQAFVVGVDLGQSQDFTAICVLHHYRRPLETWSVDEKRHVTRQDVEEHFDVRHLQRLRLGMSYVEQVARVRELLARPPLRSHGCDLVLDQTGPGASVGDLFEAGGLDPIRVTITSGFEAQRHNAKRWGVPKHVLVSTLDAALHRGALRFAQDLLEADAIEDELKNFQRHVTAAGRAIFEARSSKHDDLVLSVAVGLWWAGERRRTKAMSYTGAIGGLY